MQKPTIMHRIEYLVVHTLIALARWLPSWMLYRLTGTIAWLFRHLGSRRRAIAAANMARIYPRWSPQEITHALIQTYRHLGQTVAEIVMMVAGRLDIDEAIDNTDEALEKLAHLRQKHPGGWMLLTAHFSNWELLAQWLAKHDYAFHVVGRKGDNPLIDHRITLPFRARYGNRPLHKKGAALAIAKALKRGERVGILIDQKVHPPESIEVKLMGHSAHTTPLPATLKKRYPEVAVIPIFIPRIAKGRYRIEVGEAIGADGTIEAMTQAYNDALGDMIMRYPHQWLWMHDRWRLA